MADTGSTAINSAGTGAASSVASATTWTAVPTYWGLIPTGLTVGDSFRLLFLSSTKRNASSSSIGDYNTFVQDRAAAGHADIEAYSDGFKVVGCTTSTDARDNTETTYTSSDKGVPIYWLNGAKVADQYEDFYDGSWDDEANDKNESGNNGPDTSLSSNWPFTGCRHNGTETISAGQPLALGNTMVRIGRPSSSTCSHGPLGSGIVSNSGDARPFYRLFPVFIIRDPVLVSNTGQTRTDSSINVGNTNKTHSQTFTTGPAGANLASVGVYVEDEDLGPGRHSLSSSTP